MDPIKLALSYEYLLRKGAFIAERRNINGTMRYCIYENTHTPLLILTKAEYRYVSPVLIAGKNKTEIISRSRIREQHGRTYLKSIYLKIYKKPENELKSNTRNSNAIQKQGTS